LTAIQIPRRRWLQCLGLGLALIFHSLFPLMSPSRMVYYHNSTGLRTIVAACFFDMVLGTIAALLLWQAAQRAHCLGAFHFTIAFLGPLYLFALDPALLQSAFVHLRAFLMGIPSMRSNYLPASIPVGWAFASVPVWGLVLLVLAKAAPRVYGGVIAAGRIALMGLGIFALLGCWYLARAWNWRPNPGRAAPRFARAAVNTHPRLVWILFDEWSYAQTFSDRPPDLPLPNFDAFAADSTVYSNVRPIGYWTEFVLPSLLLGRTIDRLRASQQDFPLIAEGPGPLEPFPTGEAITADAQRLGWNVGIDGWYNPYCSFLAGTYQRCTWIDYGEPSGPMIASDTLASNMISGVLADMWPSEKARALKRVRGDGEVLFAQADQLLHDDSLDFLFLHFPLPHPPSAWDRKTGTWADAKTPYRPSYEDNLALADRELGHIMQVLRADPRWPVTTVILNGDHSWRTKLHEHANYWTPEDEHISHQAYFDDRPAVAVHAAGQTQARQVRGPVSLMIVHDLAEATLQAGASPGH
jgi:hypothetical protein